MGKYIEIDMSFKDKLILLFFDLIPERYIKIEEKKVIQQTISKKEEIDKPVINNIDEEIPSFFDIPEDDIESNF